MEGQQQCVRQGVALAVAMLKLQSMEQELSLSLMRQRSDTPAAVEGLLLALTANATAI